MILGIDAYNIRAGGGITHLSELLNAAEPERFGCTKVIVWTGRLTMNRLPKREWLHCDPHPYLDRNFFWRIIWLLFVRRRRIKKMSCDFLFVPGGTEFSSFKPMVAMSQNLLPFEITEIKRFGISLIFFKFLLLRITQGFTFKRSSGVIFLTPYAEQAVVNVIGPIKGKKRIIPHGIHPKFYRAPDEKEFREYDSYTETNPCRIVYVSMVEVYKHQWQVVKAMQLLREKRLPVTLDLVGPPGSGSTLLEESIKNLGQDKEWLTYHGAVPYETIQNMYKASDIGVFASSCETYGQIVTEAMAASLPLACSSLSSMKDIIGPNTVYFHPEKPVEIANAIEKLMKSNSLRTANALAAFKIARKLTWESCADNTFDFFREVYHSVKK